MEYRGPKLEWCALRRKGIKEAVQPALSLRLESAPRPNRKSPCDLVQFSWRSPCGLDQNPLGVKKYDFFLALHSRYVFHSYGPMNGIGGGCGRKRLDDLGAES